MPSQNSIINLKEIKNIIFDLDGTLIDSAPSILGAFKQVLEKFSYAPIKPLNSGLIGPPLRQTLQAISGESDPEKLTLLVDAFKINYDNDAYALSTSYAGIPEMLESLAFAGKCLHLATNKRFMPTKKILQFFEWEKYFQTVYAIDKAKPAYAHKAHMIQSMISDLDLKPKDCVYIGDRVEDAEAASDNLMPFVYVDWGYGPDAAAIKNHSSVKVPNDLQALLSN
jgi:phosphoglycolate phosphatase